MSPLRILFIALAVLAPTACGDAGGGPGKAPIGAVRVGFAQIGSCGPWREAETRSMQDEAAKRRVALAISDAQTTQDGQIAALRTFIAQRVGVILLAPLIETGWDTVLGEARRAGIPVILVDRGVKVADEELYTTLVASDFVEEGRLAATWLAQRLHGVGTVVELQGSPGAGPANDRRRGFAEILALHPALTVAKSQSGDFNRAKGREVMAAFLASAKGAGLTIDAVFAHNDEMALGAIQAITEASLSPGHDIVVVSVDGIRGAFEAMAAGTLNATIECSPLLGPLTFDTVERVLAGQALPKRITVTDRLFDQGSAQEQLPLRRY
jgi:ABC-type sugar transport system substrate-binding protein